MEERGQTTWLPSQLSCVTLSAALLMLPTCSIDKQILISQQIAIHF